MTSPLSLPPELVDKLFMLDASEEGRLIAAYRAGADQELEACCKWLEGEIGATDPEDLRIARRFKPPSLKEQALAELNLTTDSDGAELSQTQVELIRRALEQLPDTH